MDANRPQSDFWRGFVETYVAMGQQWPKGVTVGLAMVAVGIALGWTAGTVTFWALWSGQATMLSTVVAGRCRGRRRP